MIPQLETTKEKWVQKMEMLAKREAKATLVTLY